MHKWLPTGRYQEAATLIFLGLFVTFCQVWDWLRVTTTFPDPLKTCSGNSLEKKHKLGCTICVPICGAKIKTMLHVRADFFSTESTVSGQMATALLGRKSICEMCGTFSLKKKKTEWASTHWGREDMYIHIVWQNSLLGYRPACCCRVTLLN